ncbi:hypothetical protein H0H92_007081 [Tricholoma furcatifolium]|nr:hypothetical protein H0H92_007081 [Tricholoma furcatifolium]
MATPDAKIRLRSDYTYFLTYRTRWSDNDQYSHMNNSIYYHLFDSIFFSPLSFPEVLNLGLRVTKLGTSSVTYEIGVFKENTTVPAAVGGYTHVFVDSQTRKSKAMDAETKTGLSKLYSSTPFFLLNTTTHLTMRQHVNTDQLIRESHVSECLLRRVLMGLTILQDKKPHFHGLTKANLQQITHSYGARYGTTPVPKYRIASKVGNAFGLLPVGSHSVEDGSPVLNLASFVHTWMPPEADKLFNENISKNLIGISILADMWHAPSAKGAIGTATTGSSEAIQLGGLAMKKIWQAKRKAAGKSIHEPGPNIIMGANAQVALEKFARYFEVECRLVPVSVESHYRLDAKKVMEYVDENTIGVFVILGSTYTGHYEPVKEVSDLLDEHEAKTGHSVPIHVDAASGGFIAPFATPKLLWDFKLPRVVSINTSGHKFGLSYVGVGWVIWRDKAHLPKELIFELHYLGSVEYSFSLNFSRPAAPIIAQYFNFLHLGFEGYRAVALDDLKNARLLSRALEASKYYTVLSDIHRKSYHPGLPVVSFRFSDEFQQKHLEVEQRWIQTLLRAKGWIVPNYELPPSLEQVQILRVVVRESMTEVMEITESLARPGSASHGLNMVAQVQQGRSHAEKHLGNLEKGSANESSGTYARTC